MMIAHAVAVAPAVVLFEWKLGAPAECSSCSAASARASAPGTAGFAACAYMSRNIVPNVSTPHWHNRVAKGRTTMQARAAVTQQKTRSPAPRQSGSVRPVHAGNEICCYSNSKMQTWSALPLQPKGDPSASSTSESDDGTGSSWHDTQVDMSTPISVLAEAWASISTTCMTKGDSMDCTTNLAAAIGPRELLTVCLFVCVIVPLTLQAQPNRVLHPAPGMVHS